jgi:hypothetical protein
VKEIAQNVAQPIYGQNNTHNLCILGKKAAKKLGYFGNFYKTAQSKRSLIGRKFAQSGHPAHGLKRNAYI